jgi:hypothetical protein
LHTIASASPSVKPASVDASGVGQVLSLFEKLVLVLAGRPVKDDDDEPEDLQQGDSPVVSAARGLAKVALVDIETASDGLILELDRAIGEGPCRALNDAANRDDIEALPPRAQRLYEKLTALVTIEQQMGLQLEGRANLDLPSVEMRAPSAAGAKPRLRGPTTIIAKLMNVGLKAKIRITGRKRELSVELNEEQALAVKNSLFELVILDGTAEWDPLTLEVKAFRVADIRPAVPIDPSEAFTRLRAAAAGTWDGVDPEEYARAVREEDA